MNVVHPMSHIKHILSQMCAYIIIEEHNRILQSQAAVLCNSCQKQSIVKIEAVYKQYKRGRDKYICKSCSSKAGWTEEKRDEARIRTARLWRNPDYAGVITGKSVAREIIGKAN